MLSKISISIRVFPTLLLLSHTHREVSVKVMFGLASSSLILLKPINECTDPQNYTYTKEVL